MRSISVAVSGNLQFGQARLDRRINTKDLSKEIANLVDLLRSSDRYPGTLSDVATITEVLITCMESYFASIDTQIYRDMQTLSEDIAKARQEIALARPGEITGERIPRAGKELDAIVKATESATHEIMQAAEAMTAADPNDPAAYRAALEAASLRIFEACSFQDITGQRIRKVVQTLSFIEDRIKRLVELPLGYAAQSAPVAGEATPPDADKLLLNGPALEGEGVSQSDVDDLFDAPAAPTAASEAPPPRSAARRTAA
ncbi:MAG: protein phosphatase CheZ [Alphaproteobacteria bacterium]|nr:protein phosphatase CheZ [Alphaproteobacteria bacterium]